MLFIVYLARCRVSLLVNGSVYGDATTLLQRGPAIYVTAVHDFANKNCLKFNQGRVVFKKRKLMYHTDSHLSVRVRLMEMQDITHLGHKVSSVVVHGIASFEEHCKRHVCGFNLYLN